MTIYEWSIARMKASTSLVAQISSNVFPDFMPSTALHPGIIYEDVSDKINRKLRQNVVAFKTFAASKAQTETINSIVYGLFDSSTAYITAKSSSLCIDSVKILNNVGSGFDDQTKLWYKVLDVQFLWHYST